MDYSQGNEQAAILAALGDRKGNFLDIGAYHPKVFSNTRALYEKGWNGVMVEPSPWCMQALIDEYGQDERITLISGAIGRGALTKMWVTPDAVSTSDPLHMQKWKEVGGYRAAIQVPTVSLQQIWNQFGGFDFVNIDAEGESASIFLEYISHQQPWCICVEHDSRELEIAVAAGQKGYKMLLRTGENTVFGL